MTPKLIEKLNQTKDSEEQIKIADEILSEIPFYLDAYFTKGYALYELGRADEAIETFEKSLEYDAHHIAENVANNGIGVCLASKGEFKKALKHFEISYNLNKTNENVILNIARMHEKLNENEKALEKYEEILKINPENEFADFKVKMLSVNPDFESIPEGVQKANFLYQMEDYEKALKIDDEILKIQDDCVPAFHNQGLCYTALGLIDKALESYENVLKINPNALHALNNMGFIYIKTGEYEKANEVFERNIKAYPDNEQAYANNAYALMKLKEYEKSIEMSNKSLEINPNLPETYNNLAWCYEELNNFSKALECYDKSIEINPNHGLTYNNKAWALRKVEKYDEALKCYDKALELDGENAHYFKNIAITYKEMEDLNKAHEFYNKAFSLDQTIESFEEL